MKLSWIGIEWGEYAPGEHQFYFYWWNWLPHRSRFLGFQRLYYDGPHATFGFWFFNVSWSTYWTKPPKEFRSKES